MVDLVILNCKVFFFSGDFGGKNRVVKTNYHQLLDFSFQGEIFELFDKDTVSFSIGQITNYRAQGIFIIEDKIESGEFTECSIKIVRRDWLADKVVKGGQFLIIEGSKIVGYGKVL